jgi:hypothetical protein
MANESSPPHPEETALNPHGPPAGPAVATPLAPLRRSRLRLALRFAIALLLVYLLVAYLIAPTAWNRSTHRHPSLEDVPGITHAADGIPGDPINVALIGTKAEIESVMLAATWRPADPLSLRSSLEIAEATVLKRQYEDAPVSNLYLFGRKEDLAFEQPGGNDPRRRNHVRFWRSAKVDPDGRPVWMGSATYDERVGLSHRTGQITHHVAADVDAERDHLFKDLEKTGLLSETYIEAGWHKTLKGRNGGGDPWYTDGDLYVGVIKPSGR